MRRDDRTALPKVQEVVNDPSEDARQMAQKPVTQPTLLKRPRDAVAHCAPDPRAAPSTRTICGWGWDTARPDLPIKVDLFDGNLGL